MIVKTKRRLLIALLALVGIPIAAYLALVAFIFLEAPVDSYLHASKFDSQGWKQRARDDGEMWPTRLRMVDDLIQRRLLDGRSREQVEELLGPADKTPYFRGWDLVYHLGPERGFIRIDSEWLVIRVNAEGKVTAYRLARD